MNFVGKNQEFFEIIEIDASNVEVIQASKKSELSLLWFTSDKNQLKIDSVSHVFNENDIISLTEFHIVEPVKFHKARLFRWNRSFYCIVDHDSEISCKGILYYGASRVPHIKPSSQDIGILETVYKMLLIELESKDNLQFEMLQMMLKRLLILCTRIYKQQEGSLEHSPSNIDIIREFNFLVESHFKSKHTVSQYADLLNKSPKTLSNLFKKLGDTSPLQFIHSRIMLEARRMLTYTSVPVSEIGYELGFSDVQVFSRFFRKHQGESPQIFREREELPTP